MVATASPFVLEVNEADFTAVVEQSTAPVFVDFWAPWCGPCLALAPIFEQLAEAYNGQVKFIKVNIDECKEVAQRWSIRGIPSLLLFRNGEVVERVVGGRHKAYFTSLLNTHVQQPVALPKKAAARLHAFKGDERLRDEISQRVRAHIEAGRIVSHGSNGPISDAVQQRYSLMGAATDSADVRRFEEMVGVPAAVGRLQEVIHSLLLQQHLDGADKRFRLDPAHSSRPLEWWQSIAVGVDLSALPSHFIQWLLRDLIDDTKRYGIRLTAATRLALESLIQLHARQALGEEPGANEWQAVRAGIDVLVKLLNDDDANASVRAILECTEQLAWPVDDLDDALSRSIGQMLFLASEAATPDIYTPAQWSEQNRIYAELSRRLHRAMRDRVPSFPDMTPMQKARVLEGVDDVGEVEAMKAFLERRRPVMEAHSVKVSLRFGEHLHIGLMHSLAAATLFQPKASVHGDLTA